MAKRSDIKKVFVIGAGPIQIGQGCEFDYSGTQACKALREEGYKVVLLNSNPATIMTDPETADQIFIEPLTLQHAKHIIATTKPDAILPTVGGQVALNLFLELHESGFLREYNIKYLGVSPETICLTEDRQQFRALINSLGLGCVPCVFAATAAEARGMAKSLTFPLVVRASYALGGTGGGVVHTATELEKLLKDSPAIGFSLEKSIAGWKEYELEIMRDSQGTFTVICTIENLNPMGVHTGDSVTVAPAMTLTDKEYQYLRDASKKISQAVGMETGGANIQFAVHPDTGEVVVVEMNPRVSRSSALASKAVGYPIARIAARLAIGRTLAELSNEITQNTTAAFEPTIDYVAIKIPRFDTAKFGQSAQALGVEMKSVGEVLALGRSFKDAWQKAWRALEQDTPSLPLMNDVALSDALKFPSCVSFMLVKIALQRGWSLKQIHGLTSIGIWFLNQMAEILEIEKALTADYLSPSILKEAKRDGFSNKQIAKLQNCSEFDIISMLKKHKISPTFRMVDSCAGEFLAKTPYYYKTYEDICENIPLGKKAVVIVGAGPNRIGQGIEFDYSCVHAIQAVNKIGLEAVVINCNPETVSTDFSVSNKLFMEPITAEDVLDVLASENPLGVLLQFGGQTPLKLAHTIAKAGYTILGTSPAQIDLCENRAFFAEKLREWNLDFPSWALCRSLQTLPDIAEELGYPIMVRPSFVLGGKGMHVIRSAAALDKLMNTLLEASHENPFYVDKFIEDALEFDVDVICDGETCLIPAIMEHLEEAGIHSGDSTAVIPPLRASQELQNQIRKASRTIALGLQIKGLLNIQFAFCNGILYVIEANPRASRSLPFVAKALNLPLAQMGALACLGHSLKNHLSPKEMLRYNGSEQIGWAVKTPVFPFSRFPHWAPKLGPEMRSIGEVMTTANTFPKALHLGLQAAGYHTKCSGSVLISCEWGQIPSLTPALKQASEHYQLVAPGFLAREISKVCSVPVREILTDVFIKSCDALFTQGEVALVLAPLGEGAFADNLCRSAVAHKIPYSNSLSASQALVQACCSGDDPSYCRFFDIELTLQI